MTDSSKHILHSFDQALEVVEGDVLMMAALADRSLEGAMRGLFGESDELCNVVIADDDEIDQLEKEIDRLGVDILIRFQPVASDLRQVIAAMRMSSNLERIGDQAVNIARKARKLQEPPGEAERTLLDPIFTAVFSLLRDSIRAYTERDAALANSLPARDKEIDQMAGTLAEQMTQEMAASPARISDLLAFILISRHLERVGDHAKNIAEDAVYAAAAEDIRHPNSAR